MRRTLEQLIAHDLDQKIVLLSGPRQVGKTTLSRALYPSSMEYFNLDHEHDRLIVRNQAWSRDSDLVIFDELHKLRTWKRWLKGIYDTEGVRPRLLATGSARLDLYRKGGDSLAGRFFSYRLHPFSVAEVKQELPHQEALERILRVGGFPEPFLKGTTTFAKRWQRSVTDRILHEDIFDIASVHRVRELETLLEILRHSVGSPISYDSIARDLQVSPKTVKQWLTILESLFVIFRVTPYSRKIRRSLLKQPKIYLYDTGLVVGDDGARFENAVAGSLLKRLHYIEDTQGEKCQLWYLRDKEKREVDFLITRDHKPELLLEAKLKDPDPSQLKHFRQYFPQPLPSILLVYELRKEMDLDGFIKVRKASKWLSQLET